MYVYSAVVSHYADECKEDTIQRQFLHERVISTSTLYIPKRYDLVLSTALQQDVATQLQVVASDTKGLCTLAQTELHVNDYLYCYGEIKLANTETQQPYRSRLAFQLCNNATTWILDMSKHCSKARFIAHSCDPNCTIAIVQDEHSVFVGLAVVVCSDISKGQELTIDYKWNHDSKVSPCFCFCGSPKCRIFIEKDLAMDQFLHECTYISLQQSMNELQAVLPDHELTKSILNNLYQSKWRFSSIFQATQQNQQYVSLLSLWNKQRSVLKSYTHLIAFGALISHFCSEQCNHTSSKACTFCTEIYMAFINCKNGAPTARNIAKQLNRLLVISFLMLFVQECLLKHFKTPMVLLASNNRSHSTCDLAQCFCDALCEKLQIYDAVTYKHKIIRLVQLLQGIDDSSNPLLLIEQAILTKLLNNGSSK